MRKIIVAVIALALSAVSHLIQAQEPKNQPVPIISATTQAKAAPEWFSFSDEIGNFVVLTFDDGPFRQANGKGTVNHTGIILDILKREGIQATFFILGFQLDTAQVKMGESYQKYCQWLTRMFDEGHTVAIHDRNHIQYYKQSKKDIDASFAYTKNRVREISGRETSCYVRSPGGTISSATSQYLKERGYKHVFWNINSEPEQHMTPKEILTTIIKDLNRGKRGIIMMHDRNASEFLDELLRYLKANRIEVIPLEEWERRYGLPNTPQTSQKIRFE